MNRLLIFVSFLGFAYAGVVHLGPAEESHIVHLYEKLCGGGGYGENGQIHGGALVYCKEASGGSRKTLDHRVKVPGSRGQDQIVFVRPAPAHYDHNILVQGADGSAGKTKVYVLPQKSTHNVKAHVKQPNVRQEKPTVFFLSGSGSSTGYPHQPAVPLPAYGPSSIKVPAPPSTYDVPETHVPSDSYAAHSENIERRSDYITYPVQVEIVRS